MNGAWWVTAEYYAAEARANAADRMAEAFAMARGARAQTATPERRAEIEARVAELQGGGQS